MRGNQGPMPQNSPKADTLAKERQAHEACDTKKRHGEHGGKPSPMPMRDRGDRKGGY